MRHSGNSFFISFKGFIQVLFLSSLIILLGFCLCLCHIHSFHNGILSHLSPRTNRSHGLVYRWFQINNSLIHVCFIPFIAYPSDVCIFIKVCSNAVCFLWKLAEIVLKHQRCVRSVSESWKTYSFRLGSLLSRKFPR